MDMLINILAFLIVLLLYFVPSLVAIARGHVNTQAIAAANFLFGWTIAGWGIALVWALTVSGVAPAASAAQAPIAAGKAGKLARILCWAALALFVVMLAIAIYTKTLWDPSRLGGKGTGKPAVEGAGPPVKTGVPVPANELFGE